MSVLIPMNCYNCLLRDGYPENLGGDENCLNYKMVTHVEGFSSQGGNDENNKGR